MSKNAIALIDCNDREVLFGFLTEQLDSKAAKNEMISPYDDQLIGKMNFRFQGVEHAMFFTFAKASEYPGMRFRGHKIIYVSLDVSESSSQALTEMCQYFGGYINHNDDLEVGFEQVERTRPMTEEELEEKQAREEQLEQEKQEKERQAKEIREAKENAEEREAKPNKEKKHEQQHKNEHKPRNFHKGRYNKQNQQHKGNQQNKPQNQGNTQPKEN